MKLHFKTGWRHHRNLWPRVVYKASTMRIIGFVWLGVVFELGEFGEVK